MMWFVDYPWDNHRFGFLRIKTNQPFVRPRCDIIQVPADHSTISSIFSISFHYSTCLSSILSISYHYSTCLSSIFSISFHYSTYFSSVISELEVKETTDTASSASFVDLYLEFDDSGQISTKIYDKRDDFNFKIINFPNMCSNIPASPAYGVYISQLIRCARASSNYSDFLKRHLHLRNRLLDQGYEKIRLIRSLKRFIFRYQDLVEIYSVSAEKIINDGFSCSENV